MDKTAEKQLLNDAIAAAQALGLKLAIAAREPHGDNRTADAVLDLQVNGRTVQYRAEIKRGLRPATLGGTLLQLEKWAQQGKPVLLVTDYVTPPLADTLRERGMAFLDAIGNAYIHQPPLFVWVKGQRPATKPEAMRTTGRAFQATGLKVIFALLCQPKLVDRPYRTIATVAGVAHGTVGWVMADLNESNFVIHPDKAGRRLRNARRLLEIWAEAYARVLRPKLLLGRYRAPHRDWWEAVNVQNYELQLGAEPAAARLHRYLHPGIATSYGGKVPGRLLADHQLRTDPKGDVEIRQRFWNFNYTWEHSDLVPPLLIFADLLATGDARCVEAAKRIDETYLAGLFE